MVLLPRAVPPCYFFPPTPHWDSSAGNLGGHKGWLVCERLSQGPPGSQTTAKRGWRWRWNHGGDHSRDQVQCQSPPPPPHAMDRLFPGPLEFGASSQRSNKGALSVDGCQLVVAGVVSGEECLIQPPWCCHSAQNNGLDTQNSSSTNPQSEHTWVKPESLWPTSIIFRSKEPINYTCNILMLRKHTQMLEITQKDKLSFHCGHGRSPDRGTQGLLPSFGEWTSLHSSTFWGLGPRSCTMACRYFFLYFRLERWMIAKGMA